MFNHKHYVPVLKTKAGERWAVDHLSHHSKQNLTPLFEIHRHKSKDNSSHADEMCENLASIWGTSAPYFLDTCWLHAGNGDPTTIEAAFTSARTNGMLAIPIVRLTYDQAALDAIRDIHNEDGRAYLLRITQDDVGAHHAITAVVNYLGIAIQEAHLMVDYRHHPMDLAHHIPGLPSINEWATLTAASGTFPRSLASFPTNAWHVVQRHDWQSWLTGVTSGSVPRRPAFGDYTIRDPGPPAEGGAPSVNLRYCKDDHWRARIGRKFKDGYATDMHDICADLIAQPWYDGAAYSEGDRIFNEVAQHNLGPGAPQQWVQWGVNHHLTFAVNQIQNHPSL